MSLERRDVSHWSALQQLRGDYSVGWAVVIDNEVYKIASSVSSAKYYAFCANGIIKKSRVLIVDLSDGEIISNSIIEPFDDIEEIA